MRMNIQGWDSLAFDERHVDPVMKRKSLLLLYKHLGAARVKGVKDCNLWLVKSGAKKDAPTRVLNVRFTASKGQLYARAIVSVTSPTLKTRNAQYIRALTKVTLEILEQIEAKTEIDLKKCRAALARDLAKLVEK